MILMLGRAHWVSRWGRGAHAYVVYRVHSRLYARAYLRHGQSAPKSRATFAAAPALLQGSASAYTGRLRFDPMRVHCAREPRKSAAGVLTQSWIETLKLSVSVFHHWPLTTRRARLTRT